MKQECSALKWEGPLADFKARLASGEDVFGQLMDKYLLSNNHRVSVITLPDSSLGAQIEKKEKQRIESARSQMTADDVRPCPPHTSCAVAANEDSPSQGWSA
jgi:presequence protease